MRQFLISKMRLLVKDEIKAEAILENILLILVIYFIAIILMFILVSRDLYSLGVLSLGWFIAYILAFPLFYKSSVVVITRRKKQEKFDLFVNSHLYQKLEIELISDKFILDTILKKEKLKLFVTFNHENLATLFLYNGQEMKELKTITITEFYNDFKFKD